MRFEPTPLPSASCSLSAVLDPVSPSATGLGLCSVLSGSPTPPLWRLSFTFPRTRFSKKHSFQNERARRFSKSGICLCYAPGVLPCRYYLKCYIFVSQLEALNIPYTLQSFLSTPKEGLVKGLWKNHSHEPQVTRRRRSLLQPGSSGSPTQPLCFTGGPLGGRSVLRISGVRPSAVEQSASKAAGLQLGEQKTAKSIWKTFKRTVRLNFFGLQM